MGVFHVFQIVQMVPNRAMHHILSTEPEVSENLNIVFQNSNCSAEQQENVFNVNHHCKEKNL